MLDQILLSTATLVALTNPLAEFPCFLAATDAHMGNSGMTNEEDFARAGHVGTLDEDPVQRLALEQQLLGSLKCRPR